MNKYTITLFEDELDLLISLFDHPTKITVEDVPTFNSNKEEFEDMMESMLFKCLAARGVNPYHVVKMKNTTSDLWSISDSRESGFEGTRTSVVYKTINEAYKVSDKKYRELVKGTKWEVVDEEDGFSDETMSKISKLVTAIKNSQGK